MRWQAVLLILLTVAASPLVAHEPGSEGLTESESALALALAGKGLGERERVFHVETSLLREKKGDEEESTARLALVTHYAYEGDVAILTTVDLERRAVVSVDKVPHLAVPLSEQEFDAARDLAMSDPAVRDALGRTAEKVEPEVLMLRAASEEDPLFGRRAVRMMFRVGEQYLSWPIAIVDLTEKTVELEAKEPPPGALHPDEIKFDREEDGGGGAASLDPALESRLSNLELTLDELLPFRTCCPRHTQAAAGGEVVQEFPPSGPMETAWKVRFGHATGKGLYITGAWFKRSPADAWQRILWDARLSDIFVPYHSGSPRYLDLTGFNFNLEAVQKVDLGCCGKKADDFVVKEVRDRGMLWKNDSAGRRGHTLVLWATLDAANYNYIIEYGFRDDGMISFRLGATARNLPGREWEAHMHNGLWRVDVDLAGHRNDSALRTRHDEPVNSLSASDHADPFNGGKEGSADWQALEFTGVRVQDTQIKNGQNKSIAYDLMPLRRGRARHQEDFTRHDFWVTRYRGAEVYYTQLPTYTNGESVLNTDVVLWHISPAHHLPRSEDGEFKNGAFTGNALLMWGGFDLRPRNFFDRTPFQP